MEYPVGILLALGVSLFASLTGLDRDRAFYPVTTVVIASYYELFAVMGGSTHALSLETAAFFVFVLVAVIGYKKNLWLIVGALAGHGVFDLAHPHLITDPGVPSWWPMFCLTYDLTAAMCLAWLLNRTVLADTLKGVAAKALAVLLFAFLVVVGGSSANAAETDKARTVTVDGHRVAFRVVGSGRPAIVLIAGLGDGMATFQDTANALGQTNTVIVYDRAGYGGSDPGKGSRDASAAERELFGLLAQSGVTGPFVLSGHSLGGLFAEYYAAKHPDQISGLILEESRPADFTRRCTTLLGAGQCLPPAWLTWLMPKGARGEAAALEQAMAQVEGSAPLRNQPVLVLSRANRDSKENAFGALWAQAQDDLATRYPGSRHLIAETGGHYIHLDEREWFLMSVRAFLTEVR